MVNPLFTPSRMDAQQWAPDFVAAVGLIAALRSRGIACDVEVHPITRMAIIAVEGIADEPQYVIVYDPLDGAVQLEVARRVAAFFDRAEIFIDGDDPRDPVDRLYDGAIGADMLCSLQTRIILEVAAITACDADTVLSNDYVAAGGPDVTPYIGTTLPWEEQRGAADSVDWLDRFEAIDDWCKSSDDRIGRLRALCGLALLGLVNAVES